MCNYFFDSVGRSTQTNPSDSNITFGGEHAFLNRSPLFNYRQAIVDTNEVGIVSNDTRLPNCVYALDIDFEIIDAAYA